MAGYKYVTILTDVGKQKLAEAIANETALDFTEIAIGDANGVGYEPTSDMTSLKNETYRAAIGSLRIDEVDKNIMIFEFVVPASSGGYYLREAGLFASDGSMIAIARTAEQYKPLVSEGAGASITISMRIAVSSDAQVYINIPESISYATQTYVNEELKKHKTDANAHEQYLLKSTADETYSKNNHSHNFANITGSMDITDSRIIGNLPVNRVTGAAAAPKYYTTSTGKWIETICSDDTVIIEGMGTYQFAPGVTSGEVSVPKVIHNATVITSLNVTISLNNDIVCRGEFDGVKQVIVLQICNTNGDGGGAGYLHVNWYLRGTTIK